MQASLTSFRGSVACGSTATVIGGRPAALPNMDKTAIPIEVEFPILKTKPLPDILLPARERQACFGVGRPRKSGFDQQAQGLAQGF